MDKKLTGFNRILINKQGEAVSLERALEKDVLPEIAFLRKDGWVLGAPLDLQSVAFNLWKNDWTHFVSWPDRDWVPISEYGDQ